MNAIAVDGLASAQLEAATEAAAKEMKAAQTECVRELSDVLYKHVNGYAEPQGAMLDGVWIPDPSQYFPQGGIAAQLSRAVQDDTQDGGSNFRAKKLCKSWRYCWWLATAYLEGRHGLPGYVTRAASGIDFDWIRDARATRAANEAAKVARALAFKAERATPEFKSRERHAKAEAKLESVEARIAGLTQTIKDYEKKLKRAHTLLKKARREHKQALKRRANVVGADHGGAK